MGQSFTLCKFIIILNLLFLVGCGANTVTQLTSTPKLLSEKTNDTVVKSLTKTATIQKVTVTPTKKTEQNPTPSISASLTPQSTLTTEEGKALVLELIASNGGCQLPCWWGITPGETSWDDTRSFLETFTTISNLSTNLYGVTYRNLPENVSDGAVGATISVNDGLVQTIVTDVYYPLSEVLAIYGQPSEVRIFVDSQSIDTLAPFVIALYYEQGFLAVFRGKTNKGVPSQICPSSIGGNQTVWFLWSPNLEMPFEKAGRQALLFVSPADKSFRKLEETTDMNVRSFYETYRDVENVENCFEWYDQVEK